MRVSRRSFVRSIAGLYLPAAYMAARGASVIPFNPQIRTVVSSGGFVPTDVSGLKLWLAGRDTSTTFQDSGLTTPAVVGSSDPVGGWKDKSGLGNHFIQATSTKRPTLAAGLDSLPTLTFDGVDDQLDKSIGALTTNTVFIMFRTQTGAPSFCTMLFDTVNIRGFQTSNTAPNYKCDIYAGGDHNSANVAFDTWSLFTGDFNGAGTGNAWVGGTQFLTAATLYSTATYNAIGGHGSEYIKGQISEILVYDTVLSATNRGNVWTYLRGIYPSTPA